MNKLILLLMLVLTGCATTHDYCMAHLDHYSSYDECYQEREARKQRLSHAFDGMGSQHQTHCTSYSNPDGTIYTNCY